VCKKNGWLFGVVIAQVLKTDHGQPIKRETGGKGGQLVELWAGWLDDSTLWVVPPKHNELLNLRDDNDDT